MAHTVVSYPHIYLYLKGGPTMERATDTFLAKDEAGNKYTIVVYTSGKRSGTAGNLTDTSAEVPVLRLRDGRDVTPVSGRKGFYRVAPDNLILRSEDANAT
jgi:hypothetical protein